MAGELPVPSDQYKVGRLLRAATLADVGRLIRKPVEVTGTLFSPFGANETKWASGSRLLTKELLAAHGFIAYPFLVPFSPWVDANSTTNSNWPTISSTDTRILAFVMAGEFWRFGRYIIHNPSVDQVLVPTRDWILSYARMLDDYVAKYGASARFAVFAGQPPKDTYLGTSYDTPDGATKYTAALESLCGSPVPYRLFNQDLLLDPRWYRFKAGEQYPLWMIQWHDEIVLGWLGVSVSDAIRFHRSVFPDYMPPSGY